MLPTDYNARKNFPLMTVLASYFPDAIEALVELCVQGNVQHKVDVNAVNPFKLPTDTITWDHSKSTDHMNCLARHVWDHERAKRGVGNKVDGDKILHIVKALWRAAAEAQETIVHLRKMATVDTLAGPAELPMDGLNAAAAGIGKSTTFRDIEVAGGCQSTGLHTSLCGGSPRTRLDAALQTTQDLISQGAGTQVSRSPREHTVPSCGRKQYSSDYCIRAAGHDGKCEIA